MNEEIKKWKTQKKYPNKKAITIVVFMSKESYHKVWEGVKLTAIEAEETEWEKKHLAVTNQNELRKEVVRYVMPT